MAMFAFKRRDPLWKAGCLLLADDHFSLSEMTTGAISQLKHIIDDQYPGVTSRVSMVLPYSSRSGRPFTSPLWLWRRQSTMYTQRRFSCNDSDRSAAGGDGHGQAGVKDEQFVRYASPDPSPVEHAAEILACPETKITLLSNGLRIVTEHYPRSLGTATVGLWIDSGSRFDTDETSGTAHFLEHMIFKGTTKRSCDELGRAVETAGAKLSASTKREQTNFIMRILKDDVLFALDTLADMLLNSTFSVAVIEQEQETILREMKEVQNEGQEMLFDHLHARAFWQSPLGRPIRGYAETVMAIKRITLMRHLVQHFTASRMVVVAVGPIDHKHVVQLSGKFFKSLRATRKTAWHWIGTHPTRFTGSEVRTINNDMPYAQLAIAVEGASWRDPDSIALMVIQSMLGNWNTDSIAGKHERSLLGQKVAADSLAESIMAFNFPYSDGGLFGIHAVAKEDVLKDLSRIIMHELGKLTHEVDDRDVLLAKHKLKSSLALQLADSTQDIAELVGHQLLTFGRRVSLTEQFARIDQVDATAVKRVATRFFRDKDLSIAAMGPVEKLPSYNWFRLHPSWVRQS